MADKKISALTGAATPLAGTEVLPIVQSGTTVKVSAANLTEGRNVRAASVQATPSAAAGDILEFATFGGAGYIQAYNNVSGIAQRPIDFYTGTSVKMRIAAAGDVTASIGDFVVGTAGKGITTSVTNGDVTVTPLGTGKTILAKNGLKIPNNAAVTVGTSATQISVNAVSWSSLAFVFGVDGGGNAFSDLVFYADGTAVALASRTVSAAPAVRTYPAPGGQLNLAMGSGSYSVFFQHIWAA